MLPGPGAEVHSKPLNAVKRPGSLYFVAIEVTRSQMERVILSSL